MEPSRIGVGERLVTNAVSTPIYKVWCAPDIFTGTRDHSLLEVSFGKWRMYPKIVCTKRECARINTEYLDTLDGNDIFLKARHNLQTQKKYTPFICKKEGTIGNSSFMDNLRLKIGCKVILIHNIDTSDGLTNGQLGALIDILRAGDGTVSGHIVEFKN